MTKSTSTIDLDNLSYDELVELNRRVVERLKYWDSVNAYALMMEFEMGQEVSFESNRGPQRGVVTKFNQKTISVITKDNRRWNVSPHLLSPIKPVKDADNIITLKKGKKGKRR